MGRIRQLVARMIGLVARGRRDAEIDEEMRAHLDLLAEDYVRRGLSPADARLAARRDFGSVAHATERYRDQRGFPFFDTLFQDVRYALRLWRRAPGFSAVVVAVLALGIGANSAMFTLVNALLFRPLSGRAADLVGVYSHDPTQADSYRIFSYPNYADLRARGDAFDSVTAYTFALVGRPAGDVMRRAFVEVVAANFFDTIGVGLAAGRTFTADEDRPGADMPVAIASYASWQDAGFDPAFLGRTLRINTRDFTIVGVAPKGFTGTTAIMAPELWLPLGVFDSTVNDFLKNNGHGLADRDNASLMVAAHLRPGVSMDQANRRLAALSAALEREHPVENRRQILSVHTMSRVNVSSAPSTDAGPATLSAVLMPLSGAVLLIACLNIANMLLARGTARKKEIAIRLALGGGRARIVRQLLTESLVLALAGAGVGLLLGSSIMRLFAASLAPVLPVPLMFEPRPDRNILLAATLFAVLSALAFGLAPALKMTRPDLVDDLKDVSAAGRRTRWFGSRAWIVVCQIAVSLMLMVAGGLFARGALRASGANPGYRYDRVLLASIDPSLAGYNTRQAQQRLGAALDRLRRLPGVDAVGAASQVPFGDVHEGRPVARAGDRDHRFNVTYTAMTSDYFRALGLPIVRGRDFTRGEEAAASDSHVAIVDEPLARRLWGGEDPIGRTIVVLPRGSDAPTAENEPLTVVGIVPGLRDELFQRDPAPHLFIPAPVHARSTMHLHVRTAGPADAAMLAVVRRELRALDDRLPVIDLRTMQDFHDRGLLLWVMRAAGRMLSGLGGLALLLAAVGVYGVKSYVVAQRTREIGIRLALGARPRDIASMLVRDGARTTLTGVAIGFPLAVGLGQFLSRAMFDVSAFDPVVLVTAPLVLIGAAALATYLPARRGMRVSPLDALRTE